MSDAGLRQSQAYTKSLHDLEQANKELDALLSSLFATTANIDLAKNKVIAAKAARNVAYKAYTNPFNVRKTV